MRAAAAVAEILRFQEQPVRHDLILRRRRHEKLARGLVGRMIDRREPLARDWASFFAEGAPLAALVGDELQPVGRSAVIRGP